MSSEIAEVVSSVKKSVIPAQFWNLEAFGNDQNLIDIHAMVQERLQLESPDADILEIMMMERVAFLYMFMRAVEQSMTDDGDGLKFTRDYKEMMGLWVSMAADLRKTRLRAEETQGIRMAIVAEVSRALKEALKEVDPKVAETVRGKLINLVAV